MSKKAADGFDAMARAVAVYLEHRGWTVLVAGPASVQHWPGERKYNHEFVLRFTGVKPKKARKTR